MLQYLHVKNLALIDEIEVEFGRGLNILTGETGAGKSIILGSVNLALGGRYTKDILRQGTRYGRKRRATEALQKVGLGNQLHKHPSEMSGGQMQRVAIARALVNNPDILLADEPTGALDSETSIQVMELLKEVAKDRLVVMVTHNPELAQQYATRIVNLKDGVIRSDTAPYEPDTAQLAPAVHKNSGTTPPCRGGPR